MSVLLGLPSELLLLMNGALHPSQSGALMREVVECRVEDPGGAQFGGFLCGHGLSRGVFGGRVTCAHLAGTHLRSPNKG